MAPGTGPGFAGAYDFDLLAPVWGQGCATNRDSTTYWAAVEGADLAHKNPLVMSAEAAAVFDALSKVKDADTILLTRMTAEAPNSGKVCVTVWGRAVRLKKAGAPATPASGPGPGDAPSEPPPTDR